MKLKTRNLISARIRRLVVGAALSVGLALFLGEPLRAAFSEASGSVAAEGLGGSFVAKADDATALFLNPAGLSQLSHAEATFMYGKPFVGLENVSLYQAYGAGVYPVDGRWTVAAGGSMFSAASRLSEREGIVGGAFKVNDRLSLGANLSFLHHVYSVDGDAQAAQDPIFASGRSKGALGLDVGALFRATQKTTLGFSVRHLNKPDVGLATKDPVPMELRTGFMTQFKRFNLLGDVLFRDAGSDVADGRRVIWSLGGEWIVRAGGQKVTDPMLALRAGINSHEQLTTGFGVGVKNVRIDYAFTLVQSLMEDNAGTHRMSFSYRFGRGRGDKTRAVKASVESPVVQTPVAAAPVETPAVQSPVVKAPVKKTAVKKKGGK